MNMNCLQQQQDLLAPLLILKNKLFHWVFVLRPITRNGSMKTSKAMVATSKLTTHQVMSKGRRSNRTRVMLVFFTFTSSTEPKFICQPVVEYALQLLTCLQKLYKKNYEETKLEFTPVSDGQEMEHVKVVQPWMSQVCTYSLSAADLLHVTRLSRTMIYLLHAEHIQETSSWVDGKIPFGCGRATDISRSVHDKSCIAGERLTWWLRLQHAVKLLIISFCSLHL